MLFTRFRARGLVENTAAPQTIVRIERGALGSYPPSTNFFKGDSRSQPPLACLQIMFEKKKQKKNTQTRISIALLIGRLRIEREAVSRDPPNTYNFQEEICVQHPFAYLNIYFGH